MCDCSLSELRELSFIRRREPQRGRGSGTVLVGGGVGNVD